MELVNGIMADVQLFAGVPPTAPKFSAADEVLARWQGMLETSFHLQCGFEELDSADEEGISRLRLHHVAVLRALHEDIFQTRRRNLVGKNGWECLEKAPEVGLLTPAEQAEVRKKRGSVRPPPSQNPAKRGVSTGGGSGGGYGKGAYSAPGGAGGGGKGKGKGGGQGKGRGRF